MAHEKKSSGWHGAALIGSAVVGLGALTAAGLSAADERFCRPVVPQVNVTLIKDGAPMKGAELYIRYAEVAREPLSPGSFPDNLRHTSCETFGAECIAERKRYERRFEGERFQAVQILGMGVTGKEGRTNPGYPIIGNIRWEGMSYPHRLSIDCDLDDLNPKTACQLKAVDVSWADVAKPARSFASAHDQCRPNSFSTSSMLSFTQVGRP